MTLSTERFRREFARTVAAQLLVRFHMALIFTATVSAGMVVSKAALENGLRSMPLRYLLAAAAAYVVFLILVRLWIAYALSVVDLSVERELESAALLRGERGRIRARPREPSALHWLLGEAFADLLIYLLLFLAIVASLLIAGAYLVWQAPLILVEGAFEVWLASTLLVRVRGVERRGWLPIILRRTTVPFVYVAVMAAIVGGWLQHMCPSAVTLFAALRCWLPG
jgi:hypothetical protein